MMIEFNNKNIILITPLFFGYEDFMVNFLHKNGANVFLLYDNPENAFFKFKLLRKINKSLFYTAVDSYYKSIISRISSKIDYVLVIKGSYVSKSLINLIKKDNYDDCKFIMYQWDSIYNNDYTKLIECFDRTLSFDINDCLQLGLKYRPLFFNGDLVLKRNKDIDISFIGSMHGKRIDLVDKICSFSQMHNLKTNIIINAGVKNIFLSNKYKKKFSNIRFGSISIKESYDIYSRSKIVFDYTNENQSGFTMRTIEAVANGCKLMTNNNNIISADFYNEKYIKIYDNNNIQVIDSLLNSEIAEYDKKIISNYALDKFMIDIFE